MSGDFNDPLLENKWIAAWLLWFFKAFQLPMGPFVPLTTPLHLFFGVIAPTSTSPFERFYVHLSFLQIETISSPFTPFHSLSSVAFPLVQNCGQEFSWRYFVDKMPHKQYRARPSRQKFFALLDLGKTC